MNAVRYWAVFSLGLSVGAAIALAYAPQTGEKTRRQLKRNLRNAGDYIKDTGGDLSKHAKQAYKSTKDVVGGAAAQAGATVGNVADKLGGLI